MIPACQKTVVVLTCETDGLTSMGNAANAIYIVKGKVSCSVGGFMPLTTGFGSLLCGLGLVFCLLYCL